MLLEHEGYEEGEYDAVEGERLDETDAEPALKRLVTEGRDTAARAVRAQERDAADG